MSVLLKPLKLQFSNISPLLLSEQKVKVKLRVTTADRKCDGRTY